MSGSCNVNNVPELLSTISSMLAAEHTHAQSMRKQLAESNSIHGALHVCACPEKLYSLLSLGCVIVKVTG